MSNIFFNTQLILRYLIFSFGLVFLSFTEAHAENNQLAWTYITDPHYPKNHYYQYNPRADCFINKKTHCSFKPSKS